MWFEDLVGFSENGDPEWVRSRLEVDGDLLTSKVNGKSWRCGRLEIPSLEELRLQTKDLMVPKGKTTVSEVLGDVQKLHASPGNEGCLFQVASQFNLLEMVHPGVVPEWGVGIYENDFTQGPACAIACGAGTIYRNYFVELEGGQVGQTKDRQVDCLRDLSGELRTEQGSDPWKMRNGYAVANLESLEAIADRLKSANAADLDFLRGQLRIGVQWDSEVTLDDGGHLVSQAYCSALPVAYSDVSATHWEPFARLVLEASYEAILRVALLNRERSGKNIVYLTLLGGGAFGNEPQWIIEALQRAVHLVADSGLGLRMVSHRQTNPMLRELML